MNALLHGMAARPLSLSQIVYDQIRNAIIEERIPPGTRISEVGLARDLSVSKTPVRDAMMRLREIRLVEPHGTQGLRVVMPSRERIAEAYETRSALESWAARLGAERAAPATREKLMTGVLRARDVPISGDSLACANEHVEIAAAIADRRSNDAARHGSYPSTSSRTSSRPLMKSIHHGHGP